MQITPSNRNDPVLVHVIRFCPRHPSNVAPLLFLSLKDRWAMHLPRHPFASTCRRRLCLPPPRRRSRVLPCAPAHPGPAELRGGRAGEGQARRPPSPSPAPPPSRAPAVALCSPSSSVRGRGAATLPCSLGGERGRRSAAGRRGGDLHICPALATGPVHVRSDVAFHVGGQRWSEAFWTSINTLE